MYSLRIDNKVIIITGGYGYLGKAIVDSLIHHGAQVVVAAKSKQKFLDFFDGVANVSFEEMDVSQSDSIVTGIENIYNKWGKIDCFINNAFYTKGQSPETMSDEDWAYGIDGTLSATFRCIKAIVPYYKMQGFGKIINVSSMYGMISPDFEIYNEFPEFLNPPHYGAAKAGIIQMTKYYAGYLGKININVNSVTPGPFPSEPVQKNEGFINELKLRTCLNRIGKPEDLAGVFSFLSSDAANFITGQNFIIDGGWTTK